MAPQLGLTATTYLRGDLAMGTLAAGVRPANPTRAPYVPAGPNTLAAFASSPTRRSILGALAAVPALAVASVSVGAVPIGHGVITPGLLDTIQDYRRASALAHHYNVAVHEPAYNAWREAIGRIPHVTTTNSFQNALGHPVRLTTADEASVAGSRSVLRAVAGGTRRIGKAEYLATLEEQVAAAALRDAEADRLSKIHGVDATCDRLDLLNDAVMDAIAMAAAFPARNAADLAAKIAFVAEMDWWDVPEAQQAITADARRLAGEA